MRTNQRAQSCAACGEMCQPGQGRLEFVPDAEDNDDFDRLVNPNENPAAHWEVYCLDTAACDSRQQATAARHAAEAAQRKADAAAKAAELKSRRDADLARWQAATAGLERTEARPEGYERTGEFFAVAGDNDRREKIILPDGQVGWLVSWIGDMDGCCWLVPAAAKESAEAEKARLHRVYQWWRPGSFGDDSYPGPGVPESELTEVEKTEVATRYAAKYAAVEENEKRTVPIAIVRGDWKGARGCDAWESLVAAGCQVELVLPDNFSDWCRRYADSQTYSKERDALAKEGLVVTLRATAPAAARNKNGSLKAAFERKISHSDKTSNRFVRVRVEIV